MRPLTGPGSPKPIRLFRLLAGLTLASLPAAAQITVAVAANVQFAMEDLQAAFRKAAGADVGAVYGSSGKLAAQIRNGAPYDVFVSADMDFPDSLAKWGYASGRPRPYAYGKLVLWTTGSFDPGSGLAGLAKRGIGKVALADPDRAPYGREAVKALKRAGAYDAIKGNLVYGESIAQVNQYILLGAVDAGFTAQSAVLAADMRGKGKWAEVDGSLYDPIAQGAVICKYGTGNHPELAAKFLAYLYSPPARAIFAKYGYGLP
jgi:molybdate transport system substrate-binding protein